MNTATLYKAHVLVQHGCDLLGNSQNDHLDGAISALIGVEENIDMILNRYSLDKDAYFKRLQAVLVRHAAKRSKVQLESLPDDDLDAITLIAKHHRCRLAVQLFHNLQADYSALKR